jgi:putative transposase
MNPILVAMMIDLHELRVRPVHVEYRSALQSNATAAKASFRKALKRHGEPRVTTLDGFEPSHAALRRMGMNNEFNYRWDDPVQIRNCPYLNNVVEQDHRRV